jgi:peptide/nickel transport system permease protein
MTATPVASDHLKLRTRWVPSRPTLHPLLWMVSRRLLLSVPLLFVVTALSFVLISLTNGHVAREILGLQASQREVATLQVRLGLNLPIYEQYWHWLKHALGGNLGTSWFNGLTVTQMIRPRIPVTVSLILVSLLVVSVLGVSLGIASAVRGGVIARFVDIFTMSGFALPAFWVGAILISLFAVRIHWFPAVGYVSPSQSWLLWLRALVLPVIALSLHSVAAVAKQTREAMLDTLGSEYVRMARANGVRNPSILFQHALKNAAIRIVTMFGILTVGLLSGTVIVETVFALPGMGSLAVTAAAQGDLPVVQGVAIYFTVIVVIINLLVDLAYTWLNPRVTAQ